MRRRSREIVTFNLSMMDVIAGAMAAFLVITVVLLPYYRRETVDYREEVERLRAQIATAEARAAAAEAPAPAAPADAEAALRSARAEAAAAREAERAARAEADALRPRDLDLMIVLDSTGSMGEEIASLRADAKGLVRILSALSKSLRVGVVAYRDRGAAEAYLTRIADLAPMTDSGLGRLEAFLDALDADGGGDGPEAIDAALAVAMDQPWNRDADGIIVVIGDAPVHAYATSLTFDQARDFASLAPRFRVSTISSGPAASYLRALAEAGRGVFMPGTTALLENIVISILRRGDD
jgi:hypothetical protein